MTGHAWQDRRRRTLTRALLGAALVAGLAACSDDDDTNLGGVNPPATAGLPTHDALEQALKAAQTDENGGLDLNMWATVVDRSGIVVAVAFTGQGEDDQWPGSRVISAQKANTANAFSLATLALSTANLFTATQPGGSLFGLQESNPVNTDAAYGGDVASYGTTADYMIGKRIGGVNVFGGGLALYDAHGEIIGAIGVSGDTSCADHNIAWKTRDALALDHVPAGVADGGADDNIIYDIQPDGTSTSGFGHPECSPESTGIAQQLPVTHPIGG
ncbi:MAG TPA: heme-binding protein [Gemmatimonadales bacterium]|nr:heme-binding protein [Gemmatimonadales bacterium]